MGANMKVIFRMVNMKGMELWKIHREEFTLDSLPIINSMGEANMCFQIKVYLMVILLLLLEFDF